MLRFQIYVLVLPPEAPESTRKLSQLWHTEAATRGDGIFDCPWEKLAAIQKHILPDYSSPLRRLSAALSTIPAPPENRLPLRRQSPSETTPPPSPQPTFIQSTGREQSRVAASHRTKCRCEAVPSYLTVCQLSPVVTNLHTSPPMAFIGS